MKPNTYIVSDLLLDKLPELNKSTMKSFNRCGKVLTKAMEDILDNEVITVVVIPNELGYRAGLKWMLKIQALKDIGNNSYAINPDYLMLTNSSINHDVIYNQVKDSYDKL